jgi:protein involved in polysaccharide export with SLBB domain
MLSVYVIEPPDILMINPVNVVPKSPHYLEAFDGILVRVNNTHPHQPIQDAFVIDPEGKIDLGSTYGRVSVIGLTVVEAQDAIRRHMSSILENPEVSVSLAFSSGAQQVAGKHLVAPDGRVNLGTYGSVYVSGMTIVEARQAIERQLSNFLDDPTVVVDIVAYNSKRYYVITQAAGPGDSVAEFPITGNETVLDAIARIGGIPAASSTNIWIARPAPNQAAFQQILNVHWDEISKGASTETNYQLLPGDRLHVSGISVPAATN